MAATSRELMYQTLNFENPARAPRDLLPLPYSIYKYPGAVERIREEFPVDLTFAPCFLRTQPKIEGNMFAVGRYVDEWGSRFTNMIEGIVGQVKDPLIKDWATDVAKVHVPREQLTLERDQVNRFCAETELFVLAGGLPRPFEQLQFLRGSANVYLDLMLRPPQMMAFLKEMHHFYCELLEVWGRTDVDALQLMDDWGSQRSLLVDPELWRELFKPMYRDYAQIAHGAGKKCFMHSDGWILPIYPDLIEVGIDAINSQIHCMGPDKLAPFAGQITFWGEIDRQHLLPYGTNEDVDRAVREVHRHLWRSGGCIAECEFGIGPRPDNVRQVFATWDEIFKQQKQ